jgi:diguanylate cyclase (GGDEF)-like protein/PAS domain S-box-containing protein
LVSNNEIDTRPLQTTRNLDALFAATLNVIHERDVLKLKLYNVSGNTVYSSARGEIGGSSVHPDLLAKALRGETVHRVELRDAFFSSTGEMHGVYVALSYMPLMHAGKRIGVIELYDDVTPVFKRLHAHLLEIALLILGAFAALYTALFFAVSRADRAAVKWQKSIADSEAQLRESQLIAGLGSYVLDIRTGSWQSSEVLDQLFGIDDTYAHTVEGWRALLHPDERAMMIDYLNKEVIGQRQAFDKEFRIIRHNDQAERWVHGLGKLELDVQGRPVGMHGTLQDITERKRIEQRLLYSKTLLRQAQSLAAIGSWQINMARNELTWSDETYRIFNLPVGTPLNYANFLDCVHPADRELVDSAWQATLMGAPYRIQHRVVVDGETRWVEERAQLDFDALGNLSMGTGSVQDITDQKLANIALQESDQHLNQAQAIAHMGSWIYDLAGKLKWSDELYRIFGVCAKTFDLNVENFISLIHPEDQVAMQVWISACISGQQPDALEFRCIWPDGTIRYIKGQGQLIFDADGKLSYVSGTALNITERKRIETEFRIAAVSFEAHEAIMITDADSNIVRVNRAFSEITGYSEQDVLGVNPRFMSSGRHDRSFYVELWQQLRYTGFWTGEIWDKRKNGQVYPKWLTITAVKNEQQQTTHYVAIFSDITERKRVEEEIYNLAFYDALTKLPNRRLFLDRFHAALATSARHNDYGAVLFIDLDRFKALNDTLGHDYGDLLLIEVGVRIKYCIREMDTVARFGGDEFVVLIEAISDDSDDAMHKGALVAEKIREALALPYLLKEHEYHSSPSIGITLYHGNDESMEKLIEHADMAMYQAKSSGRNAVHFFDPVMQHNVVTHDALEHDLHHALTLQQLHLHYQIQVDNDNRPLGAEALLRWIHPERGMIMPGQFLPVAEEGTLIIDIGRWVLQTACRQLASWSRNDKTRDLTLTVNISAKQFAQPDFVHEVGDILKGQQANPARLKLDLSERLALTDINSTMEKIHALKNLGVRLSMDNFATVYSSLSYLKQLSSDQLKIHQEFVRGITLEGNDAQLVQTIIDLAKSLELGVFAEGVETEEQKAFLEKYDCNAYQGYLFGRPVSIEEFEVMLERL